MIRLPTQSTRTDTPFPYPTLFLSGSSAQRVGILVGLRRRIAVSDDRRQRFARLCPTKVTGVSDQFHRPVPVDGAADALFVHPGEGETGLRDRAIAACAHETAHGAIVTRGNRNLRGKSNSDERSGGKKCESESKYRGM